MSLATWLYGPGRFGARRLARACGLTDLQEITAFTEGLRGDSECPYRGRFEGAWLLGQSWRMA